MTYSTTQLSAGERIFKIDKHLAKLRAKSLTVLSVGRQPTRPFFGKRRCRMCISSASRPITQLVKDARTCAQAIAAVDVR